MKFAAKLALYSAAASLLVASSPILHATNVNLVYKDYAFDTDVAKRTWGDQLADSSSTGSDPAVSVATVDSNGHKLEFAVLFAENRCSNTECPIRVYEDGDLIMDSLTCRDIATHAISESGMAMVSCGEVTLLDRKK
ncbi:hypothetical protein [Rhizobium sp. BK176]|uniref:hypothetical protein n=1 Tax=Rhizobium sp. BK176 TaxID=2587071 RepID=UPI002169FCDA|nr:hypothetical protein [Rhizobium sp. BK176]MCS4089662.1 hypothetical protein [Rhizobium sp. BK176]